MRVLLLTGSELRHDFFRRFLALSEGFEVIGSYCEGREKSLRALTERRTALGDVRRRHVQAREQSERDWFELFLETTPDRSRPHHIPKGAINTREVIDSIIGKSPDLLVSFGCSIVRGPLLENFAGRFVNVHLGLSPYYRGSGTNYWPLVNGEPEYVGTTFMYIDAGIDTGAIIHQVRAHCSWGDTPSQIGNRLIRDMATSCRRLVSRFEDLAPMPQPADPPNSRSI